MSGMLEKIFEMQAALDKSVQDNLGMRDMSVSEKLQKKAVALLMELAEVIDELNYKWWKNPKPVDMDKVQEELIDVLHFYISMCITAGMDAEKLFKIYTDKNEENFKRQAGTSEKKGYAPGQS